MITFYRKYWKTAFDIGMIALTVYLIMLIFSYLYEIATPIFLAFIIFAAIEPLARVLNRGGLKKSIASALAIMIFALVIVGAFLGIGVIFAAELAHLISKIPEYSRLFEQQVLLKTEYLSAKLDALPIEVIKEAQEYIKTIATKGSAFLMNILSGMFGLLTSVSTFLINFVIGIILAYFLSVEIDAWKRIARDKTPNTFKTAFYFLKENVLKGIVSYVKAQLKLITLTFAVIFIALIILGVNNALTIAVLAAIFDLLPLLGVSTVFIPWIVYLFIVGNTQLAIWLTVLLGLVILIRQILEPKITGDSLGVSAFTMLSFMIISLSLFGVAGLILSPILIILIKALYEQGYLKRWIRLPEEEYERS
jgi:sporulation integral membrane protein YtvI